jgi:hypothetical protein
MSFTERELKDMTKQELKNLNDALIELQCALDLIPEKDYEKLKASKLEDEICDITDRMEKQGLLNEDGEII